MSWLLAFAFTQAVEMPIYARALRGKRWRWAIAFGASAITHPVVWFVFPLLTPSLGYWPMVLCAEAFAVVVEGFYLRPEGLARPFLVSLVANGASVTLGFASRALFGVP